jgi:hypothetical protein
MVVHMTGAITGAETAYPSGSHECNPVFLGVGVVQSVFWVVFVDLECVFFILAIVLFLFDLRLWITPLVSSRVLIYLYFFI